MSKRKLKMGVCVVCPSSGRNVPVEWAMAIATLAYPMGMNHSWFISKADPKNPQMTRDIQRDTLVERALALGSKYILMLDDDTVPPAHAVNSLWYVLEQNPKAAIAAGIYCSKEDNPTPLVFQEPGEGAFYQWTLGDVFKCKGIAAGCMMIRLSVFQNLSKPWFKDTFSTPQHKEVIGDIEVDLVGDSGTDDLYFCRKVIDAGWDILAHGGVLPMHIDSETGKQYTIPEDSYPVVTYMAKREAALKLGNAPPTNLDKHEVTKK